MKKGQILEGYIERVDFPNKGIVKVEGEEKTLIVKNAIPGQKVKASINKMRKGKAEGRLLARRRVRRQDGRGRGRDRRAVSGRSDITMSAFWSMRRLYVSDIAI